MIRLLNTVAAAGLVLSALTAGISSAAADPATPADPFVQRVFGKPLEGKKTYACFIRHYDAAHLAQHPKQKVKSMKVLLTAEKNAEDGSMSLAFSMGLTLRNKSHNYESGGSCSHPEVTEAGAAALASLNCGVDCDGGGLEVKLTNDDKSVLVSLERIRIWRSGKDDDDASLNAGADDHEFRLDRTRLMDCSSLVSDKKELAALRGK